MVLMANAKPKTTKTQTIADDKALLEVLHGAHPATSPRSAELERERLISLINSMADGVIATDQNGRIMLYNGAALNILDVNVNIHKNESTRSPK